MISIREVSGKKDQRAFLQFPIDLYKGNDCYVPPLWADEMKMFRPDFVYNQTCESKFFLAYKDGELAGRIQGIIQKAANEKWGQKRVRFTRFDAIDDPEVSKALFGAVEQWASSRGMDTICGPLGYSDLEREGLLVEGFDKRVTMSENYNAPYYQKHIEGLGFTKEVDWLGSRIYGADSPETIDELEKTAEYIMRRYKLHFGPARNAGDFMKRYADGIFELIDKSYGNLYGTVPFTKGMKDLMLENFGLVVNLKYTAVILDENDRMICFGFTIPGLADGLVTTRGKYTPRTLLRLLRCILRPRTLDLCLVGVDPEWLNRGVSILLFVGLMKTLRDDKHIRFADTNLNLENNYDILHQWKRFNIETVRRCRAYCKPIA